MFVGIYRGITVPGFLHEMDFASTALIHKHGFTNPGLEQAAGPSLALEMALAGKAASSPRSAEAPRSFPNPECGPKRLNSSNKKAEKKKHFPKCNKKKNAKKKKLKVSCDAKETPPPKAPRRPPPAPR